MWKSGRENSDRCRQVVVSSGLTVSFLIKCDLFFQVTFIVRTMFFFAESVLKKLEKNYVT
jgi:hypothetical protein